MFCNAFSCRQCPPFLSVVDIFVEKSMFRPLLFRSHVPSTIGVAIVVVAHSPLGHNTYWTSARLQCMCTESFSDSGTNGFVEELHHCHVPQILVLWLCVRSNSSRFVAWRYKRIVVGNATVWVVVGVVLMGYCWAQFVMHWLCTSWRFESRNVGEVFPNSTCSHWPWLDLTYSSNVRNAVNRFCCYVNILCSFSIVWKAYLCVFNNVSSREFRFPSQRSDNFIRKDNDCMWMVCRCRRVIFYFFLRLVQAECENLVSPLFDGLIRWESVQWRTGENVDESRWERMDWRGTVLTEHDVKLLSHRTFFVDSFLLD